MTPSFAVGAPSPPERWGGGTARSAVGGERTARMAVSGDRKPTEALSDLSQLVPEKLQHRLPHLGRLPVPDIRHPQQG